MNQQKADTVKPAPLKGGPKPVRIVTRHAMRCGERNLHGGDLLGVVHLEPDVSLNYLVAAISNGFASEGAS